MKVVLCGGSGQVGQILARALDATGDEVVVLGRAPHPGVGRFVAWDGKTLGGRAPTDWAAELEGADVVVNLAGRSVNCRYTDENLKQMMASRVDSARVVGEAIAACARPPRLWLQMSTATIYAHRFDAPNDEATGVLGGDEPGVPAYWGYSVRIATEWERALTEAPTPATRKVAMRASMVMSPDEGGVFDTLLGLVRKGLGGSVAGGAQYVSWLHDADFVAAVRFVMEHEELAGAINFAAPNPLPYAAFMAALRQAWGIGIGLPATKWMLELAAVVLRTDTELVLKSRQVVPGRLLDAGFTFRYPTWPEAAADLVARVRAR